jgi:NitT/TauT family transport system permease protein
MIFVEASWKKRFLYGTISILLLWGIWEAVGRTESMVARIFPPPSEFLASISSDFKLGLASQTTSIQASIGSSVWRVAAGLILGFLAAVVVGCGIAVSGSFRLFVLPVLSLLAPIAPVAWIPLALVVFGIGNSAAIFIVFMGVFFTLTIGCVEAIQQVPQRRLETAALFGATPWQTWLHVIVPSILPAVFANLRVNFIAAWMAVLAGEMTGLRDGLGAVIMNGRNLFDNKLILLGMFLIGLTGFVCDWTLRLIQRKVLWWPSNRD